MKHAFTVLGAICAAIASALTGAYVLRHFQTTPGLFGGVGLVLLGIAIALPTPLHAGVVFLKENIVLIVPVIVDALKGGKRKNDPPADGAS